MVDFNRGKNRNQLYEQDFVSFHIEQKRELYWPFFLLFMLSKKFLLYDIVSVV